MYQSYRVDTKTPIKWTVVVNTGNTLDILGKWAISGTDGDYRNVFDAHFTDSDLADLFDAFLDAADQETLDYLAYRTVEAQHQRHAAVWDNTAMADDGFAV